MRAGFAAIGLVIVLVLIVRAIGDDPEPPPPAATVQAERPGDPAVYRRIETSSDCDALQATFDRAAAGNERYEPGTLLFDATLAYMDAADARMRTVGCYG